MNSKDLRSEVNREKEIRNKLSTYKRILTTNFGRSQQDVYGIFGLITKNKKKLKDLDQKSIVGTSSYRREFQIKKIRQDLNCKLIRGNVDTRIRKLNEGKYDAIILSYAGIKFLKLEKC